MGNDKHDLPARHELAGSSAAGIGLEHHGPWFPRGADIRIFSGTAAGLAVALMLPAFLSGPTTHDSWINVYVWSIQFIAELDSGNPYPRWMPDSFGGLGAPVFYFYPPISMYLIAVTDILTLGQLTEFHRITAAATVALFASGMTMRAWLKAIGADDRLALLYMVLPYHLADIYVRGALAEFCAFAVVPLVMLAVHRAATGRGWALLAISYAMLIATHLPTALVASLLLVAPYQLYLRRGFASVGVGLASGTSLAALYLLPALTLQSHINSEMLWVAMYQPREWFFDCWGCANTPPHFVFAVVLCAFALVISLRRQFWPVLTLVTILAIAGVLPIFLLPIIDRVQFPYRALLVVEFCLVTGLALSPMTFVQRVAVAFLLTISAFLLVWRAYWNPQIPTLLPDTVEYTPAGYRHQPGSYIILPPISTLRLPTANVPHRQQGDVLILRIAEPQTVRVRRFMFPAWSVRCNERMVTVTPDPQHQVISFQAPAGTCHVRLEALPQEKLGAGISLLALLIVAIGSIAGRIRGLRRGRERQQMEIAA